jgi:hypothetical protein
MEQAFQAPSKSYRLQFGQNTETFLRRKPMSELRWLRIEWMKPVTVDTHRFQFLRALRSDGQLFEVHSEVGLWTTPTTLRARLDAMLNDPPLPSVLDEETGEWRSRLVRPDFGKGTGDWVEEPKP